MAHSLLVNFFVLPAPSFNRHRCNNNGVCTSSDPEAEAKKLREENDGTVYDDELLEPERENVSSAMKERLTREASRGLDSNTGNTNVILYVSVAVVILVALGGQGILF